MLEIVRATYDHGGLLAFFSGNDAGEPASGATAPALLPALFKSG